MPSMNDTHFYSVALNLIHQVGGVTARQLISYCGSAEAVFKASKSKLLKVPMVGEKLVNLIQQKDILEQAEAEINKAIKKDVQIVAFTDANYPIRLKQYADAPFVFYIKGKTNLNTEKTVAIVGTRAATEYGKSFTQELVRELKVHAPLIVSGLAYGIDIAAHQASVKYGLPTVGVMASGIDVIYPSGHAATARQMIQQHGGILTEARFGTEPDARKFPARNRIIAGLADVVVVVEAKERGGALITANIANDYNKDVFAVPGDIHRKTSIGCNNLIKQHKAHLMTKARDIAYIMGWDLDGKAKSAQQSLLFNALPANEQEKSIVLLLQKQTQKTLTLDEISWKLKMPLSKVSATLLSLELQGYLKSSPGKKFSLI